MRYLNLISDWSINFLSTLHSDVGSMESFKAAFKILCDVSTIDLYVNYIEINKLHFQITLKSLYLAMTIQKEQTQLTRGEKKPRPNAKFDSNRTCDKKFLVDIIKKGSTLSSIF